MKKKVICIIFLSTTMFVLSSCNSLLNNGSKTSNPMNIKSTQNIGEKEKEKMESKVSEIINDKDYVDPLLGILEILQEKCNYGENIEKLSYVEKTIYLIGELEGEVNNGGFSQYLYNSSGKHSRECLNALNEVGAQYTSSLLQQAIEVYKNGPTNDGRNAPEMELSKEQQKKMNILDNKFYEYKDHIGDLQMKYIKDHISKF